MRFAVTFRILQNCSLCLLALHQWMLLAPTACAQSLPVLTIPEFDEINVPASPTLNPPLKRQSYVVANAADFLVTARVTLLSPFVNRQSVESNDVATQVLEADVRGVQTTNTTVNLETADSLDQARLNVVVTGTVTSNTVGLTPQARVATLGSHTFHIMKPVYFDGDRFTTKPAHGTLQARQYPQAVKTRASGLPLLGQIGDRIAWNEVQRRMPMSDAIVVRRVADTVLPKVNTSVDRQLAELSRSWTTARRFLDRLSAPDQVQWNASTTLDSLSIQAQNTSIGSRQVRADVLNPRLAEAESLLLLLSEEGVNRSLARLPMAGHVVSDTDLQSVVQTLRTAGDQPASDRLSTLQSALQQWRLGNSEAKLFSIRFADLQPLSLRFADGQVTVRLKFQVLPKVGQPGVMQLVQADLKGQPADDGQWALTLTSVKAQPANPDDSPDLSTNLINNAAIISQIPSTVLPRTINLQRINAKLPMFRLHRIQSESGFLRLSLATENVANDVTVQRLCW